VADHEQRRDEQFKQQTVGIHDIALDVERHLRNSSESFDTDRRVLPQRFRFRVMDNDGCDVGSRKRYTRVESEQVDDTHVTDYPSQSAGRSFIAEPEVR